MSEPNRIFYSIHRLCACRYPATLARPNHNGDTMSTTIETARSLARCRPIGRGLATLNPAFLVTITLSFVPLVGFTTIAALACACGCSVFDVGGLDLPQEQDHGGRVFLEILEAGTRRRTMSAVPEPQEISTRTSKSTPSGSMSALATTSIAIGASWCGYRPLNRDLDHRDRTSRTVARCTRSTPKDIGDVEVMGMYTGFFKDMSTGIMFGHRAARPARYTAPGLDRDTQIGSRAAPTFCSARSHRGLLTGEQFMAVLFTDHVAAAVPLPERGRPAGLL